MKKLITILLIATSLISCTNNNDPMVIAPSNLGTVTFNCNGETTSYSGDNDPNVSETFNIYAATLQTYKTSPTSAQYFTLDSGTLKGNHFLFFVIYPANNQRLLTYSKNGITKVNNNSILTTNTKNLQITITEETNTYISGTFSSLDINGTFTKIPKKY